MRILLLLCLLPWALWAERPQYRILAQLDPQEHLIRGEMELEWTNPSDQPLAFIPFHLYMNAFSGEHTIFMQESGGSHRGFSATTDSESWGQCQILSVRQDGRDITPSWTPFSRIPDRNVYPVWDPSELHMVEQPDDTIAILDLPQPLLPGETAHLSITFETRLPPIFARTGYWSSFHMVGQWFPKPGVWEEGRGWNVHFFHANSEFYADFSDFLVTLDVPKGFVVGATGVPQDPVEIRGRVRHTFKAARVHDFAFTAWDHWQVAEDRWKDVRLTLLYPPGNQSTVPRQFQALRCGLETCEELCGLTYPYPCFTLLDIPSQAMGAAGMEYPMLVTATMISPAMPRAFGFPDSTIMHEFIHNYFYGILATNEFEHPWMDEGMTSYATILAMERAGLKAIELGPLSMDPVASEQVGFRMYRGPNVPALAAWRFHGGGYGSMTYNRPAVFFKTLENLVGRPAINRLFTAYMKRCGYTHPQPGDFYHVVEQELGSEARSFLQKGMETRQQVDFAVLRLQSRPLSDIQPPLHPEASRKVKPPTRSGYANTVIIGNLGDFNLPVTLRCTLQNGDSRDFLWDGRQGGTHVVHFESASRVVTAQVDPEGRFACDRCQTNNAITRVPSSRKPVSRLSAALALTAQAFFSQLSLWL